MSAGQFPSSLSLDSLVLGTSPRRKAYAGLGVGGLGGERRNVTEYGVAMNGLESGGLRSASSGLSGRTITDDGLRREEVRGTRSRTSSVADEILVLSPFRPRIDLCRISTIGVRRMTVGFVRPFGTLNSNHSAEEHSPKSSSPNPSNQLPPTTTTPSRYPTSSPLKS